MCDGAASPETITQTPLLELEREKKKRNNSYDIK